MLVYGDAERVENIADITADLKDRLEACNGHPPGLERHSKLIDALIRAGELAQGVADAAFQERGVDTVSPDIETCRHLLLALGMGAVRSWRSGFAAELPEDWRCALDEISGSHTVRTRSAEGYAHYAVFPESYIEAADASRLDSRTVVIGIRSIGTSLAAVVAAALGTDRLVTVRPKGDPYTRHIEMGAELAQFVLADPGARFAIVDEGPGLSGSSFGGVADWLVDHGLDLDRLHFFPSHPGEPGSRASARHRALWARARRHHVGVRDLLIAPPKPEHRLERWVADLVGPLDEPLINISGGAWREQVVVHQNEWPPSDRQKEQLKYLARAGGRRFLVKYARLGGSGARKRATGRLLAEGGYTPAIVGLVHGFIVQHWVEGQPLDIAELGTRRLVDTVGEYLGFRARHLPAHGSGASLETLFDMAVYNLGQVMGDKTAQQVRAILGESTRLQGAVHPMDTDNRMHGWEWFVDPRGRLMKADALDHSSSHDLIGCQDIAWDIAGAAVEFDLSASEREALAQIVSRAAGREVDRRLLEVLEACYIGFQLGLWTFAEGSSPGEGERIGRLKARYLQRLQTVLSQR